MVVPCCARRGVSTRARAGGRAQGRARARKRAQEARRKGGCAVFGLFVVSILSRLGRRELITWNKVPGN